MYMYVFIFICAYTSLCMYTYMHIHKRTIYIQSALSRQAVVLPAPVVPQWPLTAPIGRERSVRNHPLLARAAVQPYATRVTTP